ncbi:hypothetical protein N499_1060 [Wolbachia pipientis wVitA]|nr:hypothetical protein N499_1060 [Wolbachia pipientis wVitA]
MILKQFRKRDLLHFSVVLTNNFCYNTRLKCYENVLVIFVAV